MKRITRNIQLEKIREFIQDELLKRGFTAPITRIEECMGKHHHISFETDYFQTVPVIFKTIKVANFSSNFTKRDINGDEFDCFWMTVSVRYNHFGGGSNGAELFSVSGVIEADGSSVYDLEIK